MFIFVFTFAIFIYRKVARGARRLALEQPLRHARFVKDMTRVARHAKDAFVFFLLLVTPHVTYTTRQLILTQLAPLPILSAIAS